MNPFEMVVILVLIGAIAKAGTTLMLPISNALARWLEEAALDRRSEREGAPRELPPTGGMESLETRLTRLEERLDFVEELRAPAPPPRVAPGRPATRGEGAADAADA